MLRKGSRLPPEILKDTRGFAKGPSPFFVIRWRRNGTARDRFAVLASLKVDRRASTRHLLKRRAAAILASRRPSGHDIIVSVLPPARDLPRETFREELRSALSRVPQE